LGEEWAGFSVDIDRVTGNWLDALQRPVVEKRGHASGCQCSEFINKNAGVAQLVEQLICNQQVGGSIPSTSSNFFVPYQFVTVDSSAALAQNTRLDFGRGSRVVKGGRL